MSFAELFAEYKDVCAKYEITKAAERLSEAQATSLGNEVKLVLEFSSRQRALEEEISRLREENAMLAQARATDSAERHELEKLKAELDAVKAENAKLVQAKAADEEERDGLEEKLVVSRRNYREALNEVELITEQLRMTERELQDANERISTLEQRKGRRKSGTSLGDDCDSSMDTSSYGPSGKDTKKKRERSFVLDHFERALTGIDEEKGDESSVAKKKRKTAKDEGADKGKSMSDSSLSLDQSPSEKRPKPLLFGTPEPSGGADADDNSEKSNTSSTTSTATKGKKSVKRKGMNYASFLQKNKGITVPKIKLN